MIRAACVLLAASVVMSTVSLPAASAAPHPTPHRLVTGTVLSRGDALTSPNARYTARVTAHGRLIIARGKTWVWHNHGPRGSHARLRLWRSGELTLRSGSRVLWSAGAAGSQAGALALTDKGVLVLRSTAGVVWSSALGNRCRASDTPGKRVVIDLSQQFARLCNGTRQVLTTPITSGATAYGDGTPTGTWHLQGKYRNTTLYPAAGGAYPVDFWMPYDGAYGMHDSSWQNFPYGSPKYRTRGSHGCVHFPHAAIAWMFRWAPIGTTVRIRG